MQPCITLRCMIANLLNDIIKSGLSEAEVGKLIGRHQSSVNRMRHGKQPPDYETGLKIEQLHRERYPDGAPAPGAQPEQGRAAA